MTWGVSINGAVNIQTELEEVHEGELAILLLFHDKLHVGIYIHCLGVWNVDKAGLLLKVWPSNWLATATDREWSTMPCPIFHTHAHPLFWRGYADKYTVYTALPTYIYIPPPPKPGKEYIAQSPVGKWTMQQLVEQAKVACFTITWIWKASSVMPRACKLGVNGSSILQYWAITWSYIEFNCVIILIMAHLLTSNTSKRSSFQNCQYTINIHYFIILVLIVHS